MVLTIKLNDISQITRIAELTQKTNQFNLTTERYTEDQIRELMDGSKVYSMSVRDRFGDNGLTGVCIVPDWDAPGYAVISVFLLSCRILGRGIEYAFMDYIIRDLKKKNYTHVYGEYTPSAKNKQVESFYPSIGFHRCPSSDSEKIFYISVEDYKSISAKHFCYE
jgi:FkbH-like protein